MLFFKSLACKVSNNRFFKSTFKIIAKLMHSIVHYPKYNSTFFYVDMDIVSGNAACN